MKLQKIMLKGHRMIGVIAGFLLVVIALSGSLLVFAPEIDAGLNPGAFKVTPQPNKVAIASILQTIQTAYPTHQIDDLMLPKTDHDSYRIMADGYKFRFDADPYTGRVLAARPWNQTFQGWVYELHSMLFAGKIGEYIVGGLGIMLFSLGMTGLIVFPGWRRFKAGWKIRWTAPKSILSYDLHKVIGIISITFIAMIAVTGISLVFFAPVIDLVYGLTQTKSLPDRIEISVGQQPVLPIEQLMQRADVALPDAKTVMLAIPPNPQTAFRITKKFPQEWDEFGWSAVYLNQYTGEVLRVDNALDGSVGKRIVGAVYPLHVGAVGGIGVKSLYVLLGLTPIALFVTGFFLWWSRTFALKQRTS
jgi:uncharacterized iron-regulated membrane protein